ncbi:MAG: GNAT family N-acetyltransferase [Opitutaceae bacterium]
MSTPLTPEMGEDLRLQTGGAEAWLWWTQVPTLAGERLGVIGKFSADSSEASAAVLAQACDVLRGRGCTLAVGPMNGNTWRSYRLVTEAGEEPPFLLEPVNPEEWPGWWRAAGFEPLAEYYSTATEDLAARDPRLDSVAARMTAAGVTIRPLDPAHFEEELGRIYDVSVVSFQANYLYTPLPQEAFFAQYRAIRSQVRPELVLLAEQAGGPVGYVFTVPDYAQAKRGLPVTTCIVKTLAVLPGRAYAGLGALLLGEVHEAARRLGFTRAIHALMHETNQSRNLSAHYAKTIRRYTLFSKRLAEGVVK